MKIAKRLACLLIAAAMCSGLAACGRQKETQETETTTETAATAAKAEAEAEEEDDEDDDTPIDFDNIIIKGSTETAPAETKATKAATTAAQTGTAKTTTAPKATAKAGKTTTAAKPQTQPVTEPVSESDVPAEENQTAGVIDLNNGSFEGEGISVDGSTILITGEGTYILSGSMTGMIDINTTKKVKLKLSGVNITNPNGPAILCTDAKRLTITLIEGTYNTLTDGYNTTYDGAICSNDTLEIKGAGALNVNGTNAHGIASDDDIIIKNGDITVNAVKSGMMANDDITISGGTIHVNGNTNGIKSKGTLHISGGSVFVTGGGKETKSALSSSGVFSLTGGCVYALGCGVSEPDPGASTQCAIAARFVPSLEAGSSATVIADGMQFMRETSPNAFNMIFVSTPDIHDGMTCTVLGNDVQYGQEFITGGILTCITAEQP